MLRFYRASCKRWQRIFVNDVGWLWLVRFRESGIPAIPITTLNKVIINNDNCACEIRDSIAIFVI